MPELLIDFITSLDGYGADRLMSGLAADGEPGTDELAGLSKVVFSTTLSEPLSWPNTQLVSQDAVETVREMKAEGAKSMRTLGSLTLCRSLLKAGLVDRFRVVVFLVSTEAPVGTGFTTGTLTSPSTWLAAAPSIIEFSCSSTSLRFCPGHLT